MKNISSDYLVKAGAIGAAYAVLTLLLAPLSYGVMQIRISESLIALALFEPAAIPGLTVGCLLSGILGPNGLVDALLGSLATLIGAWGTYVLRRFRCFAPIANVLSNAVIVGLMLRYVYHIEVKLLFCILWVGFGEAIACFGLGSVLILYLEKKRAAIFKHHE